jgi:hypothetical protein
MSIESALRNGGKRREGRSEDRVTSALRGHKNRERKELTDPNLADSFIEKPDNPDSENYGPRNPSVKQQSEPKYTKLEVRYEHPSKHKEDCDDCVHFEVHGPNKCELVQGRIGHEDWCRKFEAGSGGNDEKEEE